MLFRKATEDEVNKCYELVDRARNKMIADGRHQWTAFYPSRETIADDILRGHAYVLCHYGRIMAFGACIVDGEPEYKRIIGQWQTLQPYIVIHRLAVDVDVRRMGYGKRFLREMEKLCMEIGIHSIKIDTNHDNREMIHLLSRLGYVVCGIVDYGQHGRRFAFEKVLPEAL